MAKKFKPKFAGHGVQIDGPPVNEPTGKGLLNKQPEQDTTVGSQSDKDMVDHNLLNGLGDDLIESDAMCDVDDNGVENKPQGVKVPGHAKPTDGFTKKLSHNHENSIAEAIAEMMDGGAVAVKETECTEEGELTMEELFESYLEESGETASYEEFAGHCGAQGYETPGLDDTQEMMNDHQGYIFTPVGNGLYRKEAVPQEVGIGDLPGVQEIPPSPQVGATVPPAPSAPMGMDDEETLEVMPESADSGSFNNHHPEADEFNGKEKRVEHHSGVSRGNDFKTGAPKLSLDYSDGEGMEVSRSKGRSTVEESSVTTGQLSAPPSTKPNIKKGTVKKAGDATKAVKGMKDLGDPMKHKFENDDNLAEGVKLPKAIAANVTKIMEHVNKQLAKFPNGRKLTPSFQAVVDLNGKQGRTHKTRVLAEAAVDAEELAVIGKGNVFMEVMLSEGKVQKGMFVVELPKLADRKPAVVAEGILFRFPSIAKRFAATMIGESVTHTVSEHAFGAIIKGDVEQLIKKC